jgi:uncharacterized repeat protein (TIGR02543 family)
VDVSPIGDGSVLVDQATPSSYPATYDINEGTYVSLEAVPASGYLFDHWSGDLSTTTNPTTILIDCKKSITANFSQVMHTLTIKLSGSGATTPTPGIHDYGEGTAVSITATPDDGWQFDGWTGDVADPASAATIVTLDSDKIVTANFSEITTTQVSWPLVGGVAGGLVLVGLLGVILIVRSRVS